MTKKFLLLLIGISLLFGLQTATPAQSLEEETVLAALALNIVRFTNWPAETEAHMNNAINFCVVGDNVVQQSFLSIDNKAVGNNILHVVGLSRLRNFEQCHVLYVSELKTNILLQLLAEIKKQPLLTIGKDEEFALQGGMVGMDNTDNKITLYVNLPMVQESNLNISARLLKLAKIIGN